MIKKAIFLTWIFAAATAMGQTSLTVHLPTSGDYAVFASHGVPYTPPTAPTLSKGGDVSLTIGPGMDEVSVWNRATGNIASVPLKNVASGWAVNDNSLSNVAIVDVAIDQGGNPIQAAEASLSDSAQRDPQILDPSSAGVAKFFNVQPGRLSVTVRAKDAPPIIQLFQLNLARSDVEPKFTMSVPASQTSTATPAGAGTATPKPGTTGGAAAGTASTAAPNNAPGTGGAIITYFLALIVAIAVGYVIFTYFKKNPGTVGEKLEQLGVHVPKPDDIGAAGGAPVPLAPQPKPEPVQKIILDDAAPTPLASPIQTPYSSPGMVNTLVHEPSLVSSSGIPLPLTDGETVVGRDAGLGLSLTGETSISRRHASIVKQGTTVTVSDLGSTNGTFVNGAKLSAPTVLRPGDTVQFGAVSFRYQA